MADKAERQQAILARVYLHDEKFEYTTLANENSKNIEINRALCTVTVTGTNGEVWQFQNCPYTARLK